MFSPVFVIRERERERLTKGRVRAEVGKASIYDRDLLPLIWLEVKPGESSEGGGRDTRDSN